MTDSKHPDSQALQTKMEELEIKLKELEIEERRTSLNQITKKKSGFGSPLLLTALTIFGGLLGTAIGGILQGYWNTQLERQKFESQIIQRVLEKEDQEEIKKALLFYMDIGLISSINKDSLRDIVNESPSRLPSLSAVGPNGEKIQFKTDEMGRITFLDGWDSTNIQPVFIPQLKGIPIQTGKIKSSGTIRFYGPAISDLKNAFAEIETAGLLHLVKSWDGAYFPRTRIGTTVFSEHALGIAFDLNVHWNQPGKAAKMNEEGSVMALVPIFKKHGFDWGGERPLNDPNHFVWTKGLQKR